MKALFGLLVSLGVVGYLLILAWVVFAVVASTYGLYLAFSASIVLGILVFIVEPSPLVIGIVAMFFHKDLAQMLVDFLTK